MLHVDELERDDLPEFEQAPDDTEDLDKDRSPEDYPDETFEDITDTADVEDVTDDGDLLPDEVQAELEALAAAELEAGNPMEQALAEAQREIAHQRSLTRQAVARYRDALLAAEPDLPPELVQGETLEDVDAAAEAARTTVARIRNRVAAERPRSFPIGAPARTPDRPHPMTSHEKIAAGLQDRLSM